VGTHRDDVTGLTLDRLDVYRCDDWPNPWTKGMPIWSISWADRNAYTPFIYAVRYGTVPAGYKEDAPAPPLTPGCYDVRIDGTASFASIWIPLAASWNAQKVNDASGASAT